MRCYTETIPISLAEKEKLKEKGMPYIEIDCETYDSGTEYQRDERWCNNTYAEVFDWLMEKGVFIFGFRRFDNWRWAYSSEWRFRIELEDISQESVNGYLVNGNTWHEAANAAIEKALELI